MHDCIPIMIYKNTSVAILKPPLYEKIIPGWFIILLQFYIGLLQIPLFLGELPTSVQSLPVPFGSLDGRNERKNSATFLFMVGNNYLLY